MQVYLKVKIKSLSEEARIIKREERKHRGEWSGIASGLQKHRRFEVRPESRSAQIAYAFMRGRSFCQVECNAKREPDWKRIKALVDKYDSYQHRQGFDSWVKEAKKDKDYWS